MITYGYELNKKVMEENLIPYRLLDNAIYEKGKLYWCHYWQKKYEVLEVTYDMQFQTPRLVSVTVQWEDGEITTHSTPLDIKQDYELILGQFDVYLPLKNGQLYTGAEIKYWCFKNEGSYTATQIFSCYFIYSKYELKDWEKYYVKILNGRVFLVSEEKRRKG